MKSKNFKDLEIYSKGYALLMKVYDLTCRYPAFEKFALYSQTIRSANGVIANIAEAHGRFFFKDKVRILYIARAEATEVQSHLLVAKGRKYITNEEYEYFSNEYEGLQMGINGYIHYLMNSDKISIKPN